MDFDPNIIKPVKIETLSIANILLNKKISNIEDIFSNIKNNKQRSKLFESLNMMVSLQGFNYEILKLFQKKNKIKNLINWTYPQIRLDGNFATKFASPLHCDKWILEKNKKGIILWSTLNKNGSSLLVAENKKAKKLKKHGYWGIESLDKIEMKEIHINYGQVLIFDKNLLHKTPVGKNRISVQLRYEQIDKKFKKKTVNQIVDNQIRRYWSNKIKK